MIKRKVLSALALLTGALLLSRPALAASSAADLAQMMAGVFVGSTPNNHLRLDVQTIGADSIQEFDLFLVVSGQFETTTVRQQGVIRLESQGRGVYFGYVPHFDPTVTAVSPGADRFTENEANAACGFMLNEKGDGFSGETLGSSCALAMRGAIQKWTIEIEPGTIRLQDPRTGETLRFTKLLKENLAEQPDRASTPGR
jgi:hypothetical protein